VAQAPADTATVATRRTRPSAPATFDLPVGIAQPRDTVPGAPAAAKHIADQLRRGRQIAVFGDYDPDGTIGTSLLRLAAGDRAGQLHFGFAKASDGFGVSSDFVRSAYDAGIRTLITVDCGSAAVQQLAMAKDLGMTVIVADHHAPDPALAADHHLNPTLADPDSAASGAVISYKLGLELDRELHGKSSERYVMQGAWMAGFGARADMMDLTTDENSALTSITDASTWAPSGIDLLRRSLGLPSLVKTNQRKISALLNLSKRTVYADAHDAMRAVSGEPQEAQDAIDRLLAAKTRSDAFAAGLYDHVENNMVIDNRRVPYTIADLPDAENFTGYSGLAANRAMKGLDRPAVVAIPVDEDTFSFSARAAFAKGDPGLLDVDLREVAPGSGGHPNAMGGRCSREQFPAVLAAFERWAAARRDIELAQPKDTA
jgi:single-stranded-DNA-specific exonuclease